MDDPHHITDDEYQRLLDQDEADNPSDPWRVLRYERELPPPPKEVIGQRAQWKPRTYPVTVTRVWSPPTCHVCYQFRESCVCDPGFH